MKRLGFVWMLVQGSSLAPGQGVESWRHFRYAKYSFIFDGDIVAFGLITFHGGD